MIAPTERSGFFRVGITAGDKLGLGQRSKGIGMGGCNRAASNQPEGKGNPFWHGKSIPVYFAEAFRPGYWEEFELASGAGSWLIGSGMGGTG